MMGAVVEVCVESVESALAAAAGGADRVELCVHRAVGGESPGDEATARACEALTIPVHVLIRPHAGDFLGRGDEFATMRRQIAGAKAAGASGVVLGLLRADGSVDRVRTAELAALARPLSVTFHKAFDLARDPFEALDALIALGIDRVLTSGQAATARQGLSVLSTLVRRGEGRIVVMAGGAITPADLPSLRVSGVTEIHVGSCVAPDGMTEADRVRALVAAWLSSVREIHDS